MTTTIKVIIAAVAGIALGYSIMPTKTITKVETKEVIKEVEKKSSETDKNTKKDKVVVIIETILPDGTRRKETRIVDRGTVTIDTRTDSETKKDTVTETKSKKIVDRTSQTLLYGIGAVNLGDFSAGPDFGIGIQKQLIGPFFGGAYGMKSKTVGITLGIGL